MASRNEDGELEGPAGRLLWLQHGSREEREGRQERNGGPWTPGSINLV